MNANELFYVVFLSVITIINFCIFGAFYFLVENEPKAGVIKKIEDFILFLPKKLFFIEGVTFKVLLGIGFIVLCFILIIKFLNCDTIIEKLAPCNPTDSAQYLNNVVNTISGILVPLFTFIALVVACKTYVSQKEQTDKQLKDQEDQYRISNFESHLFQMIEQQHKLEEKVVDKYGSFRKLYMDFCVIYEYVRNYALFVFGDVNGDNWKKILLKIANYIFYFGVDEEFMCDKTYQTLIKQYGLEKEKEKLKFLIKKLNDNQILKYMVNDKLIKTQKSEELGIYYRNLFNAIQYIDSKCPYDNEVKKKEYTKLVRTNLSDFAQLMLYYNMQGERGSAWLKKDEVKSPKNDNDCLLTRYKPIKNCAISVENKDIDPRNDGRRELFSDKVIDYELKIEEKAWNK